MSQVFISYRRDDSADVTGRIYDRLIQRYGRENVFKDVDNIPLGIDFRQVINDAVGRCQVLLAVIGRQWLDAAGPSGGRRLDDPRDFVRLEIEAALGRGIPVIPVLVGGTVMPGDELLPPSLQALAFRNAIAVRRDPDFHHDVDRLLNSLDLLLAAQPPNSPKQPKGPPREITNCLGMKLILVPRGTFWMGDRGSQKQVEITRDFYISVFPVTQGQWRDIMRANPSWFSRSGGGAGKVKGFSDADLKLFPVEQVSWDDVQEFLKRLNAREKESGFLYRAPTEAEFLYRLPTEVEWEYSCRGGRTSQEECAFDFYFAQPTNDLSSDQANFDGRFPAGKAPKGKYLERTTKVGSYEPNRLGVYDMHGNVWEYCADRFEVGGSARVIRGGSWCYIGIGGSSCRASYRTEAKPAQRHSNKGFRLAAVLSGK
jgi:formylglycine-generating enzyme required for sulfatase activity